MSDLVDLYSQFSNLLETAVQRPVQDWQPKHSAKIDITINSEGLWFHEGKPIKRKEIVKVFSSILRKDIEGYCLVTPNEKFFIEVENVPFIAVELSTQGEGEDRNLLFRTNVDDIVKINEKNPIWIVDPDLNPRPYIRVRHDLNALLSRATFYHLIDLCSWNNRTPYIFSGGVKFVFRG